jgi:TorA maturation chaperone TorD
MTAFDPDAASAREDLCRFLAACYYEPCPEFSEERLFDSLLGAAQRVDPALAEIALKLGPGFEAQSLEELLVDYTRLFLGPIEQLARPYGSSWLTGEKSPTQDPTMAVRELYEQGGFDIDAGFQEVPDHVAVELEFLYLLIFKQIAAHRAGRESELASLQALQSQFLSQHLGAWIAPFAAAMAAHAQTSFYRDLAELTERFVRLMAAPP